MVAALRGRGKGGQGRAVDVAMPDLGHRGTVAAAHAGRPDHPDGGAEPGRQRGQECLGAHHLAGQAVADPDGQGGRGRLAVEDDVEVGVEGGDLVDLGHGQLQRFGQGLEMAGRKVAPGILDQVQVFDQQVALVRALAEQGVDLLQGGGVDLPPLGESQGLAAAGARMDLALRAWTASVVSGHKSPFPFAACPGGFALRRRAPEPRPPPRLRVLPVLPLGRQ